jgi:hypothetical protein
VPGFRATGWFAVLVYERAVFGAALVGTTSVRPKLILVVCGQGWFPSFAGRQVREVWGEPALRSFSPWRPSFCRLGSDRIPVAILNAGPQLGLLAHHKLTS